MQPLLCDTCLHSRLRTCPRTRLDTRRAQSVAALCLLHLPFLLGHTNPEPTRQEVPWTFRCPANLG